MLRASACMLVAAFVISSAAASAMSVEVTPSIPSPAPVGKMVTFRASAVAGDGAGLWYRFRVRRAGGQYQIIRDFGPESALDWTADSREGFYEMAVAVRNLVTGEVAESSALFQFQPLATGNVPVVTPTANSLVFIYSAPPCKTGGRMRVEFKTATGAGFTTPFKPCQPDATMNFYLAGMLATTTYTARHMLDTGSSYVMGPRVTFTTGTAPEGLYTDKVTVPIEQPSAYPILVGSPFAVSPVAHDLAGNVLWYGPPGISYFTRVQAGGQFWGLVDTALPETSVVRKFDLVGMTLLETNAARVSEQLKAMGKRPVSQFHHEARPLADGKVVLLGSVEQILTDVQGPGPVDVLGDMIIVLDRNLNVVWAWDTFDRIDARRAAVMGETCTPNAGGCPQFFLAPTANDWTHGNAVQQTPDGNFLYSSRHLDWLLKISYDGGLGDGHLLWILGKGGDFYFDSTDPYPWFSHQHDASFEFSAPTRLMVFDNGNTRVQANQGVGNSRGQVYRIDETMRVITPLVNTDLGVFSQAVGSAQKMGAEGYHFDAGFVPEKGGTFDSYSFGVDRAGKITYGANFNTILYRTFRMTDMYTPN